jgi:hypothetical protein
MRDPINVLADEIMDPDRVKSVGYWVMEGGKLKYIETRPACTLIELAGENPPS